MYTHELHGAFYSYLSSKLRDNETNVDDIVNRAENDLPGFVRDSFGTDIKSIYDITDVAQVINLREAITRNPVLRSIDKSLDDTSYTEALKWYSRFLKSGLNPENPENDGPVPVPGEQHNAVSDNGVLEVEEKQEFAHTEITPGSIEHHEGAAVQMDHVTTHERNQKARKECIDYFKSIHNGHLVCECCGFDFSKAYAEIGDDYIEIHHRYPVSQRGGDYVVNPKKDLVPLCSNCHSMIHRIGGQGDCMSLEDLRKRYIGKIYCKD